MTAPTQHDEWCPTAAGTTPAYMPEYYDDYRKEWRAVPVGQVPNGRGLPWPIGTRALMVLDLYGYEQAQALAWGYAALAASEGIPPKVRVQRYELVYNLKARKINDE